MKTLAPLCLLASILGSTLSVHANDDVLNIVLRHPAEAAGDYDTLSIDILKTLEANPDGPLAELMVRRLMTNRTRMTDTRVLVQPLERLLEAKKLSGLAREFAASLLSTEYSRLGKRAEKRKLDTSRGYLLEYAVLGPFGKASIVPLATTFAPEKDLVTPESDLDFGKTYSDRFQTLEWRKIQRSEPSLSASPQAYTFPRTGVSYLVSQVEAKQDSDIHVSLATSGNVVIWLNGAIIFDDSKGTGYRAYTRVRKTRLSKGWNRFVIKTAQSFSLRLENIDGSAPSGDALREESKLAGHPIGQAAESVDAIMANDVWAKEIASRETAEPAARALEQLALGILFRESGRADLGVPHVDAAVELAPEDPWVLNQAARTYRDAAYLPSALRRNRAETTWKKIAAVAPEFRPASVYLARYLRSDDKQTEAAEMLTAVLADAPRFYYGWNELYRVYNELEWRTESLATLRRIQALAPRSLVPRFAFADDYRRRSNTARAIELYQESFAIDKSRVDLLSTIADLQIDAGNAEAGIASLRKRLELSPDSSSAVRELADALVGLGSEEEAVKLMKSLSDKYPWSPRVHRDLGDMLLGIDRQDEAIKSYDKSLVIAPGQLDLARFVASLKTPDKAAFWAAYDEPLEEWIARVPTEGPLVEKAGAISVLDISVVEVLPDGSHRQYVHQAYKLLSEEEKDDIAQVQTPGEIVSLRTMLPDGRALEPVAALGQSQYVMPGVQPGAFTDFAYVTTDADSNGRPYNAGAFFFQDFSYRHSYLLSRYVIIAGKDQIDPIEHQLAGSEKSELVKVERTVRELPDGRVAWIWEARQAPRIQRERAMPAYAEYVPNVEVTPKIADWDEIATQMRLSSNAGTQPTPEIIAATAKVVEGIDKPLDKAKAIYAFVNDLVANSRGARMAVHVLLEKAGDRNSLFKTMLDIAGVPSNWAYLRQPEAALAKSDWSRPSSRFFPYRHLLMKTEDGQQLWLSLSSRNTPFGRLPEYFSGGKALVLHETSHEIIELPTLAPESYASMTHFEFTPKLDRSAKISFKITTQSAQAYGQKDQLKTLPVFQKNLLLRSMASRLFPGGKVSKADLEGLEDAEAPLTIVAELEAPNVLNQSGESFLIRCVRSPLSMLRQYGDEADRAHPYHLKGLSAIRSVVVLDLGEEFNLDKLPENVSLASPLGLYALKFTREGKKISMSQELTMRPGRLAPEEFGAFLEFCKKIDEAEGANVVLSAREKASE